MRIIVYYDLQKIVKHSSKQVGPSLLQLLKQYLHL